MRRQLTGAFFVAVALGVGSLALQRWVAGTKGAALALVVALFAVVGIAIFLYARSRPDVRRAAFGTYAAIGLATILVGYWTGVRDDEVDEDVVVATASASDEEREAGLGAVTPDSSDGEADKQSTSKERSRPKQPKGPVELASGRFTGVDGHAGSGKAAAVKTPNGKRTLTFTEFDVDPGPTVEVWLTRDEGSLDDRIELGTLKGNVGDQQYSIPDSADLGAYDTVVLYCIPFTVRIAVAPLS